jgi:NAD-dependent dihydropyrimidine dehydrogenase PreA subunit
MSDKVVVLLSKAREPRPESERLEQKIVAGLERWPDLKVAVTPHLYDLSSNGASLKAIRSISGDMIVLGWLYPRAAYWVLKANGIVGRLGRTSCLPEEDVDKPPRQSGDTERTVWCFDLRTYERAEQYLAEIGEILASALVPATEAVSALGNGRAEMLDEATRPRWYPVIDYSRCTNCLECLNFCLFGVFGLDQNNAILIEQPDACRAGCPACSRICPDGAIMFPQHEDPAVAGDPKASLKGLKLDLSQLFGVTSPAELAAKERERARAEKQQPQGKLPGRQNSGPESQDDLDHLVDEVDDLDL